MRIVAVTSLVLLVWIAGNFPPLPADEQQPLPQDPPPRTTPAGPMERLPWTTSRMIGSPDPPPPYRIERAWPLLAFENPVTLVADPLGHRLFLAELGGKMYSFPRNPGQAKPALCFDAKAAIPGFTRLYDFTFHPRFRENRWVFLTYVTQDQDPRGTHVSRFCLLDTDPPTIDPNSETVLIEWRSGGHNGGCLAFGPDGLLYVSTGDGSPPNPPDVHDTGQDLSDLLAAILRIDVDHPAGEKPYRIPEDNPFIGQEGVRPEIWAYGFRNPWKMSFDPATGALWVGDVGWEMWEMIFRVERGGNYGWSVMEGPQSVRPEGRRGPTPILPAVALHSHVESRSITGGVVYHGKSLPELNGAYVYGDYVTGKIWSVEIDPKTNAVAAPEELVDTPLQIITFAQDGDGELLVVDYHGGLYRLATNTDREANRDFPSTLSETGLFSSVKDHVLAPGVIGYSIRAEPWADGAVAERFLALPGAPTLDLHRTSDAQIGNLKGHWNYPDGTVFVKTLSIEPKNSPRRTRIETQLLHRDEDTWRAYTFAWNSEQTDAELVPAAGEDRKISLPSEATSTWRFASRTECIVCHTTRAGSVLGFEPPQLDRTRHDSSGPADQLATLTHLEFFHDPTAALKELKLKPAKTYPDPNDESLPLEDRARAYLHVNCAHCHRRGGGGTAPFELLASLRLDKTGALSARPTQGTFEVYAAEVISPGDPYRSVLYHRMATLGKGRMPHLGSEIVDARGLRLIHDWIRSLPASVEARTTNRQQFLKADQAALKELRAGRNVAASLEHLLASTSGALLLMHAMEAEPFGPNLHRQILTRTAETSSPVRELFERFLPPEERTKRLGTSVKAEDILALSGVAERGRQLFLTETGVQCRNCHQIGQAGKELGPALDQIGKKLSSIQLLESILEPSKTIDPKYVSYLMETSQGQVYSGLLMKRSTAEVVLKDAAGQPIHVPASEVEQLVPQKKSIMPELLLRDLTVQQVADLLAFLNSLK